MTVQRDRRAGTNATPAAAGEAGRIGKAGPVVPTPCRTVGVLINGARWLICATCLRPIRKLEP